MWVYPWYGKADYYIDRSHIRMGIYLSLSHYSFNDGYISYHIYVYVYIYLYIIKISLEYTCKSTTYVTWIQICEFAEDLSCLHWS